MAGLKTSRDARLILNALQSLTGREASIEDVFTAEELAYSFFGKTVVSHIKRYYNPASKNGPDTVAFYVKPTKSLNKGRRNKEEWILTEEDRRVYWLICNRYLLEDFNYDALVQLREICKQPYGMVQEAITESENNDVRSIAYLARIVEGLAVRAEHKLYQMEQRRKLFGMNDNTQTVKRGKAEIASLMYDWHESIQNVELQHKVDKLLEGDKN